jgi:hypothetical protein
VLARFARLGELAERVVGRRAVDGSGAALHEEGNADGLGGLLAGRARDSGGGGGGGRDNRQARQKDGQIVRTSTSSEAITMPRPARLPGQIGSDWSTPR